MSKNNDSCSTNGGVSLFMNETVLFDRVTKYLIQKYNCHSYSRGDFTEESDLDIDIARRIFYGSSRLINQILNKRRVVNPVVYYLFQCYLFYL